MPDFQKHEQQPVSDAHYVQESLFDAAVPASGPVNNVSLEELAVWVAAVRSQSSLNNQAEVSSPSPLTAKQARAENQRGGAFGGAIKRRIESSNTLTLLAKTNPEDVTLLRCTSLRRELFNNHGDQSYCGVVFTPEEFGSITMSPVAQSKRIGANVLANTLERPATDRHNRKSEIVDAALHKRLYIANETRARLDADVAVFERLTREKQAPGYSHMSQTDMDSLMARADQNFVAMLEAITTNHRAGTERVESLKAALEYLLGNDNYRSTYAYWHQMIDLGGTWSRAKRDRFLNIESNLQREIASR